MKQTCMLVLAVYAFGCRPSTSTSAMGNNTADTSAIVYAYTIEKPDNWEHGDLKNVPIVMNCLKAFEKGDIAAAANAFADTVHFSVDYFDKRLSNDSLKASMERERGAINSMKIIMDDWESVISKDKKTEYVSLWYKQIWTTKAGKTDSLEYMDDVQMKAGKIISFNEKQRHYPVK